MAKNTKTPTRPRGHWCSVSTTSGSRSCVPSARRNACVRITDVAASRRSASKLFRRSTESSTSGGWGCRTRGGERAAFQPERTLLHEVPGQERHQGRCRRGDQEELPPGRPGPEIEHSLLYRPAVDVEAVGEIAEPGRGDHGQRRVERKVDHEIT